MRRPTAAAALLLLWILAEAQALPTLDHLWDSTQSIALTAQAGIPIKLSAGPDGGTTLSPNSTGAASTVAGVLLVAQTYNTTVVNNTGTTNLSIRLTLRTTTNIDDCNKCNLELRTSAVTSTQIKIENGVVTQSQGAWVRINGTGFTTTKWYLYAVAQDSNIRNLDPVVKYQLDYVPFNANSPIATYHNMTMNYDY